MGFIVWGNTRRGAADQARLTLRLWAEGPNGYEQALYSPYPHIRRYGLLAKTRAIVQFDRRSVTYIMADTVDRSNKPL